MSKTKSIWHPLCEAPDFKRAKDGMLKIMLTDGQEIHPYRCTEENFKYMNLYWYGVKAWAYYGDLLPGEQELPAELTCAYEFVDDSEKIYQWLFIDNMRLLGLCNMKYGDEYTDEDNFIVTISHNFHRNGREGIKIAYSNDRWFHHSIEGDTQEFVRRLVEERHIRVITPNIKKEE